MAENSPQKKARIYCTIQFAGPRGILRRLFYGAVVNLTPDNTCRPLRMESITFPLVPFTNPSITPCFMNPAMETLAVSFALSCRTPQKQRLSSFERRKNG